MKTSRIAETENALLLNEEQLETEALPNQEQRRQEHP